MRVTARQNAHLGAFASASASACAEQWAGNCTKQIVASKARLRPAVVGESKQKAEQWRRLQQRRLARGLRPFSAQEAEGHVRSGGLDKRRRVPPQLLQHRRHQVRQPAAASQHGKRGCVEQLPFIACRTFLHARPAVQKRLRRDSGPRPVAGARLGRVEATQSSDQATDSSSALAAPSCRGAGGASLPRRLLACRGPEGNRSEREGNRSERRREARARLRQLGEGPIARPLRSEEDGGERCRCRHPGAAQGGSEHGT